MRQAGYTNLSLLQLRCQITLAKFSIFLWQAGGEVSGGRIRNKKRLPPNSRHSSISHFPIPFTLREMVRCANEGRGDLPPVSFHSFPRPSTLCHVVVATDSYGDRSLSL
jgi:hypothetical protein